MIRSISGPGILHNPVVGFSIHNNINYFDLLSVTFNLYKLICSKTLNCNSCAFNLAADRFLQDDTTLPDSYEGYEFTN